MSYCHSVIAVDKVVFSNEIKYISGFLYAVDSFDINTSITFRVLLLDQNSQPLEVRTVLMAGTDYANWGNDDNYLLNFISSKCGLTIASNTHHDMTAPIQGINSDNQTVFFLYLIYDGSNNIVLPHGYSFDANNNVVNTKKQIVTYQYLKYNNEGLPIVFGSLSLDASNNPILPLGGFVDENNMARDGQGEHIVIVSPSS
jgi:hypothetical protein